MRFWDASAVVPLLLDEPASEAVRSVFRADPEMVVWWGTVLECVSAISRREREGSIDLGTAVFAHDRLGALSARWMEVQPVTAVRDLARRLLRVHALRTLDALQLAAALVVLSGHHAATPFVCLDERLAAAATREGLRVVT